ncbi:hypothetical protein DL96DRAFT_1286670 [Flagelloscypha sp. PMI_526]|nr:hypothetical protein DL96DRAFT_1286670 [Flagelloscypha sp. PMI_526]
MLPPIQERSAATSKDDSHDSTLPNAPKGTTPIDLDGNASGQPTEDNLISFHDGNYAKECQDVADNADDILETNATTSHHNGKRPDRLSDGNQAERVTKISQKDTYIPYARRPSSPLTEISSNDNDPSPARIKNKRSTAGTGSIPPKASPHKDPKSSPQAKKRKISLSRSPNSEHDKPPVKRRRGYRGVKVVYSSEAEIEREVELAKSPIKKKRAHPRKVTAGVVSTPDSSGLGAQERAPNTSPAVTSNKATDDLLKNALSIFLQSAMQTIGAHVPQGSTINPSATALQTPNNSHVTTSSSSPVAPLTAETETLSLSFPITSNIPPRRSALELLSKSDLVQNAEDTLAPIVNNSVGPPPNGEREMLRGTASFMAAAGSSAAASTNNSHVEPPLTTPITLDIATRETSRGRSQDLDELVYPF